LNTRVQSADLNLIKLNNGAWNISNGYPKQNGKTVFSCFHGGGGSTMGYKLAGFNVLGGVEIDPKMMAVYRKNHNPKHSYMMGVKEFLTIPNENLPNELFSLDILDGSPPCSSFSIAGARDRLWSVKRKFAEGQVTQILDTLFFDFIDIAKKLQPKIVVAENVKGLITGSARGYVKQIFSAFDAAGYKCQLFLLNACRMGVPQLRERTFFIANKIDKKITLDFDEPLIPLKKAFEGIDELGQRLTPHIEYFWKLCKPGKNLATVHPKKHLFNHVKQDENSPSNTQTTCSTYMHWSEPRGFSDIAIKRMQTFPDDFEMLNAGSQYVCGMSVPPFMMQRLANQIALQMLSNDLNAPTERI